MADNGVVGTSPIGAIIPWAGEGKVDLKTNSPGYDNRGGVITCPDGSIWIICDGRTISLDDYPDFKSFGQRFGRPDVGQNQVFVPDMRGYFLRGADTALTDQGPANRDPNVSDRKPMNKGGAPYPPGQNDPTNVGSVQEDALQEHNHGSHWAQVHDPDASRVPTNGGSAEVNQYATSTVQSARTSTETRPHNAYVNFIIRVK